MEIIKRRNDFEKYDITLVNDNKELIMQQDGGDFTISCRNMPLTGEITQIAFDIPVDEEGVYPLFNKLYESIITGDVLGLRLASEEGKKDRELCKSYYSYTKLVKDGVISFCSDTYPLDCPNTLKIMKDDERIRLEFEQVMDKTRFFKLPFMISVQIRQSGCRYDPFHIPFNTLYKELQTVELVDENRMVLKKVDKECK